MNECGNAAATANDDDDDDDDDDHDDLAINRNKQNHDHDVTIVHGCDNIGWQSVDIEVPLFIIYFEACQVSYHGQRERWSQEAIQVFQKVYSLLIITHTEKQQKIAMMYLKNPWNLWRAPHRSPVVQT